jgi:para-nitrobenzyl esterase
MLPESEDCLRLDVWTPSADPEKRPVMVWFHGGGFAVGSAAGLWQDGGNLARHGNVVVVSVNHRLNVLGHLYLDLLDEQFAGAGNAGLLDLVLALTWIKDNIGRFGGDPENVTIFGQSGGGQKVSMLLAMPAAAGLFHKAIIQSGPAPRALESAYAADMAQRLLVKLRIGKGELRRLQDIPLAQIMSAYFQVFRETGGYGVLGILQGFAPVVDGKYLFEHPFQGQAPSTSADVPLLIGTTRTEMTFYTLLQDPGADRMDEPSLRARLQVLFGADVGLVYDAYRTNHPSLSTWERYALITSDWPTRLYSVWIAEQKARLQRAPVFMYRTDWQTPVMDGKLMAPHAIDLSIVLDDTAYTTSFDGGGPSVRRLSQQMSGSWVAFARRGDPNIRALPAWPRYEPDAGRATMLYDRECRVVNDPDGADRSALDRIVAKRSPAARTS